MGSDDALWHIWQVAPNNGWSDWESLGKPKDHFDGSEPPKDRDLSEPLVQKNADGHLEVFAPGNGAFCNRWQEAGEGPDRVIGDIRAGTRSQSHGLKLDLPGSRQRSISKTDSKSSPSVTMAPSGMPGRLMNHHFGASGRVSGARQPRFEKQTA